MKTIFRALLLALVCLSVNSIFAQEQKDAVAAPVAPPAAAEAESPALPEKTEAKAIIYFYRIKQFAGAALEPSVFVDDKAVARMDNGRFFGVALEPGKHTFRMGDKQTGFEIDMKPGQEYYARISIETGFWKGHGRMTLLMPEQGAFEIKKTKALGADKITDRAMVTVYEGSEKKAEVKEEK